MKYKVGDLINGWMRVVQVHGDYYLVTNGIDTWQFKNKGGER